MRRWFGGHGEPDGQAAALEPVAPSAPAAAVPGRRDRALEPGERVLVDGLAQKVLHGWLQNRHQTLFPLTVNLRSLAAEQAVVLAQWMAVAALAVPADAGGARPWLGSVGADAAVLAAFDAAVLDPPALHAVLAAIARHKVSAYAYVAALIAVDPHDPAAGPFLDYVAARLALPTTVVRSATRRYRR